MKHSIDMGQTVHRVLQWVLVAFVGLLTYLAKEVRDDTKEVKQYISDSKVEDARQNERLQAHDYRIGKLESND